MDIVDCDSELLRLVLLSFVLSGWLLVGVSDSIVGVVAVGVDGQESVGVIGLETR